MVETAKVNAQYCYEGYQAFLPIEVEWAETGLVLISLTFLSIHGLWCLQTELNFVKKGLAKHFEAVRSLWQYGRRDQNRR